MKAGITYEQTFLTEHDQLGIVDPTLNAPCLLSTRTQSTLPILHPCQGFTDPRNAGQAWRTSRILMRPLLLNSQYSTRSCCRLT